MRIESTPFCFEVRIYNIYMQPVFSHVLSGQKWLTRGTNDLKFTP